MKVSSACAASLGSWTWKTNPATTRKSCLSLFFSVVLDEDLSLKYFLLIFLFGIFSSFLFLISFFISLLNLICKKKEKIKYRRALSTLEFWRGPQHPCSSVLGSINQSNKLHHGLYSRKEFPVVQCILHIRRDLSVRALQTKFQQVEFHERFQSDLIFRRKSGSLRGPCSSG